MKRLGKIALGGVMLAAAAAIASPASAQVQFGFGISPRYYGPPARAACDPYSRWYDPYRCNGYNYYGYDPYAYEPYYGYGGPVIGFGFGGRFGGHRHFHHR